MNAFSRKRFDSLTFTTAITTVAALAVSLSAIWILRWIEVERSKERLSDALSTQVRIIKSLTLRNEANSSIDSDAMIERIVYAYRNNSGIGKTSEFVLARRKGEKIVFLLELRHEHARPHVPGLEHGETGIPEPIPFDRALSEHSEAMRLALNGERGTIIAQDYRGEEVIAAYSQIPELGLGIVAKIDLAEIDNPYMWAVLQATCFVLGLIAVGILFMLRSSRGLVKKLELSEKENAAHITRIEDQQRALDFHAIVSIADKNGRIKYANDHFCELSEYQRNEIVGKTYSRLVGSGHHGPDFYQEIWNTIETGEPWRGEIKNKSKSGSTYWVDTSIIPFRGADGEIEQFIAVQTDITRAKNQEHDLVVSRERAEASNQAKSMFLANMSHEIRTPMNAVLGYTELLMNSDLDDEQREFLKCIQNSGTLLIELINDILDLSKIESGEERVYIESVDLVACVTQICDVLSAQARAKGILLESGFHPSARCCIKTDDVKLSQILTNIIGNAIKFTHKGGVSVDTSIACLEDSSHELCIKITDTGIGIENKDLERVFRKFTQADSSHARKYGGTGLGLSICKGLSELLGGTLSVSSETGLGSVFTLKLPIPAPVYENEEREEATTKPDRQHFSGKALIAEDNQANQFLAKTMLSSLGMECDIVEDGNEAVEFVARNAYDIVFMDCHMPVMDGFEATQMIREAEERRGRKGLIIVALTAKAMKGDREQCLEAQMDDYVPKPFSKESLRAVLTKHLPLEGKKQATLASE